MEVPVLIGLVNVAFYFQRRYFGGEVTSGEVTSGEALREQHAEVACATVITRP